MIIASRNQLANVANPFQGKDKKVLCVCSAGLLRSPTTALVLHAEYGYNTRACGVSEEYALIPLSEALIAWADEIVFVNPENYYSAIDNYNEEASPRAYKWLREKSIVLDIADDYDYNSPALRETILWQYKVSVEGGDE
jgi:predicted protein tyrosine phosphatase